MKKVIPIILVLTMAFAFSITALAEDDIVALPPVDPGELDEATETFENFDIALDESAPPNAEGWLDGDITEDWDEEDWASYNDWILDIAQDYKESDAYDKDVFFDAIQFIVAGEVFDNQTGDNLTGIGGWITILNYNLGNNTINAILQMIWANRDEYDYILITDFEYDAETGTLSFYVDDLGFWSLFFALIERGVDLPTAARVANASSPQTSDNSIHAGIILLIVLSAATATVVISKKARIHNKA